MTKTLIDVITSAALEFGEKVAFSDTQESFTFSETKKIADSVASQIIELDFFRQPIAIYIPRCAKIPVCMAGILLSGNFYTALDVDSPTERLTKIVNALQTKLIICLRESRELLEKTFHNCTILAYEDICNFDVNGLNLRDTAKNITPDDIAFTIFTSGSTGTPKGTIITHKNVLSYVGWFIKRFSINSEVSFGSQTPFFFSMSVTDLYSSWLTGASYHIIPKNYFAFPARLFGYLNEKRVNTIYWVPTALEIAARFDLLTYEQPKFLNRVFFAGEVMPVKVLNYWKKHYSAASYINLFGPTETTDICAYYVVNRDFRDDENLPIGLACEGANLIVISDDGKRVSSSGEKGELYVGGDFVAKGYYNEPEKTAAAFVQNPLSDVKDILYKTGDLVSYNEYGELMYLGRRDSQIKYKGYRIELGEIETIMNSVPGVDRCVCLYDNSQEEIVMLYEGNSDITDKLLSIAKSKLASYMTPQKIIPLDVFPINANGKIDRALLKKTYII